MSNVRALSLSSVFLLAAFAGCTASNSPLDFTQDDNSFRKGEDPVCTGLVGGLDLRTASIQDLQAALWDPSTHLTSVKLVEAYIARIVAFDNNSMMLNAVRDISPTALAYAAIADEQRAEARKGPVKTIDDAIAAGLPGFTPVHGIPFMMKDNINTKDQPTTAGAVALGNNIPPRDATLVAKLREAGAIVLGKNELGELANWGAPRNGSSMGGSSVNAYNGGSPSGSSSGPGVAGSMAFGAVVLGSETSGSILGPTNVNSLAGLKTSHGFVSGVGVVPIAYRFDVVGPMGRNVYDLAAMMDAMAGTDPLDPDGFGAEADANLPPEGFLGLLAAMDVAEPLAGVRLGYDTSSESNDLFAQALVTLEGLGAELVPLQGTAAFTAGAGPEFAALPDAFHYDFTYYLQNEAGDLPFEDRSLRGFLLYNQLNHRESYTPPPALTHASALTPGDKATRDALGNAAVAFATAMADQLFAMGGGVDAVVSPGTGFSALGAAGGQPTAMVPLGYEGQNPIGLSFFGPKWSDGHMLAYAYAYEQATHARIPPELFNPKVFEGVCTPLSTPAPTTPLLPVDVPAADEPFIAPEFAEVARILRDQGRME